MLVFLRSGTHYLASAAAAPFVGAHEFDAAGQAIVTAAHWTGRLSAAQRLAYLRHRRHRGRVDADVAWLNAAMVSDRVVAEPEACFILTVRSPLAWIDSYARYNARLRGLARHWKLVRQVAFGGGRWPHTREDALLEAQCMPSLDGLLAYWARYVTGVLEAVPPERLLIVRTGELARKLPAICRFLGWPDTVLQSHCARRHATACEDAEPPSVTAQLPGDQPAAAVQRHLSAICWPRLGLPDPMESLPQ